MSDPPAPGDRRPALLRETLEVAPSPDPRHDYVVTFGGRIGPTGDGGSASIRMVPDRSVVTPDSLARYLAGLDGAESLEAVALRILDDLINEAVPRWIEVITTRDAPLRHEVRVEDRQPDWEAVSFPRP